MLRHPLTIRPWLNRCFLLVAWIFQFFPATPDPTLAGMNWSALIFGSFLIFFALYYWVRARHR